MTYRRPYDTDLTDPEWEHLKPLVPLAKSGGRPPIHSRREILNGIFYTVRSGCAWKLLPHDLPPWRTVYHYFWSWRRNATWQKIHDSIRASVRRAAGRHHQQILLTRLCKDQDEIYRADLCARTSERRWPVRLPWPGIG